VPPGRACLASDGEAVYRRAVLAEAHRYAQTHDDRIKRVRRAAEQGPDHIFAEDLDAVARLVEFPLDRHRLLHEPVVAGERHLPALEQFAEPPMRLRAPVQESASVERRPRPTEGGHDTAPLPQDVDEGATEAPLVHRDLGRTPQVISVVRDLPSLGLRAGDALTFDRDDARGAWARAEWISPDPNTILAAFESGDLGGEAPVKLRSVARPASMKARLHLVRS
jgi:hypothetical protein